jgi:hypothetical protein
VSNYVDILEIFVEAKRFGVERYENARFFQPLDDQGHWLDGSPEERSAIEKRFRARVPVTIPIKHSQRFTKFYNGKTCKRCGSCVRYACDGSCVECRRPKGISMETKERQWTAPDCREGPWCRKKLACGGPCCLVLGHAGECACAGAVNGVCPGRPK